MNVSVYMEGIRRWGLKGGLAILDQGLFSGSNFVLNVLLARWLSPEEYGAFALGLAVYLFISGFHNAIILEPMSIFAASKFPNRLAVYFSSQFVFHFVLTGLLGILVVSIYGVLAYLQIGGDFFLQALRGVGVFLPLTLLMWLVRRNYYVIQRPSAALLATAGYSICLLGGAVLLGKKVENLFWWFALMGGASLVGSSGMLLNQLRNFHRSSFREWKSIFRDQWLFGRWVILATILYSVGTQIQIFLTAGLLGFEFAGAFRAIQNLMLPMAQVVVSISTLTLSSISFEFGQGGYKAMSQKSLRVAGLLIAIAIGYELVLWTESKWIANILYDGKYAIFTWLIPVIGLVPLINALQVRYSLVLRALQKPAFYLMDKTLAAIGGGITAYLFIVNWGIAGAIMNLVLIEVMALAFYWWLFRRWFSGLVEN